MAQFDELVFSKPANAFDNYRARVFFDNGYGASVITGPYTYGGDQGLYEVAVLCGDKINWSLCYDTPITSDVEGSLTPQEVNELLARIEMLPERQAANA